MRGEGLSSSVPVQIFRGTRLTYLDERTKTPVGQTLVLKPIQNVRQVPLKNSPKSPFQISLLLVLYSSSYLYPDYGYGNILFKILWISSPPLSLDDL